MRHRTISHPFHWLFIVAVIPYTVRVLDRVHGVAFHGSKCFERRGFESSGLPVRTCLMVNGHLAHDTTDTATVHDHPEMNVVLLIAH